MSMHANKRVLAGALLALVLAARSGVATEGHLYVTWPPVEPDKCIAAWLIRTQVDSEAAFVFVEKGVTPTSGIPFDIPGSVYVRDHRLSASEVVIERHRIKDAKAVALGGIARKLELGFWHATFEANEQALVDGLIALWKSTEAPEELLARGFELLDRWSVSPADDQDRSSAPVQSPAD